MAEESAQPLVPYNRARRGFWNALDRLVTDALVGALEMIVLHVAADCPPQVPLPHEHHTVEAFRLDREHEAFRVRVQVRAPAC